MSLSLVRHKKQLCSHPYTDIVIPFLTISDLLTTMFTTFEKQCLPQSESKLLQLPLALLLMILEFCLKSHKPIRPFYGPGNSNIYLPEKIHYLPPRREKWDTPEISATTQTE